jgi:hypothetical protein
MLDILSGRQACSLGAFRVCVGLTSVVVAMPLINAVFLAPFAQKNPANLPGF